MFHSRVKNQLTIKGHLKIVVVSGLLTLVLVGTCLLLLIGAPLVYFQSLYSNRIVDTVPSPDGKYQLITFFRCGMDWGDSSTCTVEASILKVGEVLRKAERGNIFSIEKGDASIEDIQWLSERKLLIVYKGYYFSTPSLQLRQKDEVEIEYQWVEVE